MELAVSDVGTILLPVFYDGAIERAVFRGLSIQLSTN